ncbi:MAG: hypothetical protein D3X82_16860 [Candidatus Leucobacter sulfamidivorax]|nr:hypothetical protein [Candidatus Leucobacter sulfamidivorax]
MDRIVSPFVKAPNGDVYELPKHVASGLVNGVDSDWSYAEEPPPQRGTGRGGKRGKAGESRQPAAPRSTAKTTSEAPSTPPASDAAAASGEPAGADETSVTVDPAAGEGAPSSPVDDETAGAAADDPTAGGESPSNEEASAPAAAETVTGKPPAANASTQVWADYAQTLGIDTEGLSRDRIREQVATKAAAK